MFILAALDAARPSRPDLVGEGGGGVDDDDAGAVGGGPLRTAGERRTGRAGEAAGALEREEKNTM